MSTVKKRRARPGTRTVQVTEIARDLGCGINGVYEGLKAGEIPGFRRGNRWFIPRPAYETFMADPTTWKGRVSDD